MVWWRVAEDGERIDKQKEGREGGKEDRREGGNYLDKRCDPEWSGRTRKEGREGAGTRESTYAVNNRLLSARYATTSSTKAEAERNDRANDSFVAQANTPSSSPNPPSTRSRKRGVWPSSS